tara:strand:- start:788 stop:958 length:171 start_codon:yes stop_codon:yes gene_type:complete
MTAESVVAWLQDNEDEGRSAIVTALALKGKPAQIVRNYKRKKKAPPEEPESESGEG